MLAAQADRAAGIGLQGGCAIAGRDVAGQRVGIAEVAQGDDFQHIAGVYIGIVGKYVNRDRPCRWTGDRLLSTGNGRVIDALNGNGDHRRITVRLTIMGFIGERFCCGYSCGQKIIPIGIKDKGAIGIKPEQGIIRCLYQQGRERVAIGIDIIVQNSIGAVFTG